MEENGDEDAGILRCGHCAVREKADGTRFEFVKGRKTGRKLERFIVGCGVAQLGVRDAAVVVLEISRCMSR